MTSLIVYADRLAVSCIQQFHAYPVGAVHVSKATFFLLCDGLIELAC